jgi:hypothetical protein
VRVAAEAGRAAQIDADELVAERLSQARDELVKVRI